MRVRPVHLNSSPELVVACNLLLHYCWSTYYLESSVPIVPTPLV